MNDVKEITVTIGDGLEATAFLRVPAAAIGLVLFAHGSGSSRHSPRNAYVADMLADGAIASLLLDLLTPEEEAIDARTAQLRFDIELLARRLDAATKWTRARADLEKLPCGYFGASTGAAAALVAGAALPELIKAIVSRGGRPDLAARHLARVNAPTLLIVGGADFPVIDLNRRAAAQMTAPCELTIVPNATHLFQERGSLAQVARLASAWFRRYFK